MKALITVLFLFIVTDLVLMGCSDEHDAAPQSPMTDGRLEQVLMQRYVGDRTGLCVAAAYIEKENVSRATVCADPAQHRLDGQTVAVEIGSVTKTMTAALLASLIEEGQLKLDDSLAMYLPQTANVPDFQGQPILLKHLATHTSGLPREPDVLTLSESDNPRADLTEAQVIEALGAVTLDCAPGTQWEYSNFGFMLLSYVVAHTAGTDFETLLRERLFNPLGMEHAYVSQPPPGTTVAVGHTTFDGQPTSPWVGPINLAGEGGVHATLDDMVRYAQAQLGIGDARAVTTLQQTHDLVDLDINHTTEGPEMGMAWWRGTLDDRTILFHGGNTFGFSSIVVIDSEKDRAIVILTDTHLDYGMEEVVQHLFEPKEYELPPPRRVAVPDQALLQSLQGHYHVDDSEVIVSYSEQTLFATLDDGTEIEFGFDSRGDFYPLSFDGLVTPILDETGKQTFIWSDTENVYIAERLDS